MHSIVDLFGKLWCEYTTIALDLCSQKIESVMQDRRHQIFCSENGDVNKCCCCEA